MCVNGLPPCGAFHKPSDIQDPVRVAANEPSALPENKCEWSGVNRTQLTIPSCGVNV